MKCSRIIHQVLGIVTLVYLICSIKVEAGCSKQLGKDAYKIPQVPIQGSIEFFFESFRVCLNLNFFLEVSVSKFKCWLVSTAVQLTLYLWYFFRTRASDMCFFENVLFTPIRSHTSTEIRQWTALENCEKIKRSEGLHCFHRTRHSR